MRKWFCLLLVIFFALGAKDWLPESNIHRKADHLVRYYNRDKKDALKQMRKECYKGSEFSFYLCTLAARFAFRKDKNQSKSYLREALKQNPDSIVAANQFRLFFESEAIPFEKKSLLYYEKALLAAQKRDKSEALALLKKAIANGFHHAQVIRTQPDFKKLNLAADLKEELLRIEAPKHDLTGMGQRANSLMKVIDATYTIYKHRRKTDLNKTMALYYRAHAAAAAGRISSASSYLEQFIARLEKKTPSNMLAAHAMVFLWQKKHFRRLRSHGGYRNWFFRRANLYGISKQWLRKK